MAISIGRGLGFYRSVRQTSAERLQTHFFMYTFHPCSTCMYCIFGPLASSVYKHVRILHWVKRFTVFMQSHNAGSRIDQGVSLGTRAAAWWLGLTGRNCDMSSLNTFQQALSSTLHWIALLHTYSINIYAVHSCTVKNKAREVAILPRMIIS